MAITKWVVLLFVLYALFSGICIFSSISSYQLHDAPQLFIKDPNAPSRITAAISSDHNMPLVARSLHNKLLVSWQVFYDSVYRSVDIPFLFSLTERSALYDNPGKMQMLPSFELPFFFIALIVFIKRWEKLKKYALFLLGCLTFSLLTTGMFWPYLFPLKLVPLMITLQLFIFMGVVSGIQEVVWRKK